MDSVDITKIKTAYPEITDADIEHAQDANSVIGLCKYLYYISPIAYVFNYDKYIMARKLSSILWQE